MNSSPQELPEEPPPERPDCCGGGCAVCVLDGYADELEAWQRRRAARQSDPPAPGSADAPLA